MTNKEDQYGKMNIHKVFHPEKYGLSFCPSCHGSGKFIHDAIEIDVCKVCGGFGLTKNREKGGSIDESTLALDIRCPVKLKDLV